MSDLDDTKIPSFLHVFIFSWRRNWEKKKEKKKKSCFPTLFTTWRNWNKNLGDVTRVEAERVFFLYKTWKKPAIQEENGGFCRWVCTKKGRLGAEEALKSFKTGEGFGFEPCGLACVLRKNVIHLWPNDSNKMLILELRTASARLFLL